jgi:tryptophan-rich sensory protein
MNKRFAALISWLLFAATIAVNALANILPINGLNTGQVSGMYPNSFVPDGRTFAIWSIIYLWLLAFVAYTSVLAFKSKATEANRQLVQSISPLFWLTCLFNATWILAWHYLQVGLSLVIMLALLVTLLAIFRQTVLAKPAITTAAKLLVVVPFTIYFAWICVATIANTTALLVDTKWNGWGVEPAVWSIVMMAIATLLAIFITWRHRQMAFALVVAWALWGIYRGQAAPVTTAAIAGMSACLAVAAIRLVRR